MDFITTGTVFFVCLFAFVLICASITDIKTTYLAPATIYLSTGIAVSYVIFATITQGTTILINSLLSFVLLATGYMIICFLEKLKRKKNQQRLKEDEWIPETTKQHKSHPIIASILAVIICVFYGILISDSDVPGTIPVFAIICLISGIIAVLFLNKLPRKYIPIAICSIIALMLGLCLIIKSRFIIPCAGAALIYAGLRFLLRKQYIDTDITVDTDGYIIEDEEDREISESLIFGGGDAFVFGAIALMFGLGGFIGIFINAGLFFLLINLIKAVYTGKSMNEPAPFIPAVTIGLFAYATGFNVFNIAEIWQLLIN